MTQSKRNELKVQTLLADVNAQAVALGYRPLELQEDTYPLGPWYRVVSGPLVLGMGNTWTACLNEAREYLTT